MRRHLIPFPFLCRVLLASALVLLPSAPSQADDNDSKRESLIRDIEERLNYIRGYLDGIAGDSSTGDLDYARDKANEITSKVSELRDVKGSDSKANMMYDKYPDYVDRFKTSLRELKLMKEEQLDRHYKALWSRCHDTDRKLRDEIARYLDKNDPEGVTRLPEYADALAQPFKEELKKADEIGREMERWRNDAKRFGESNGWSDVSSDLRDGADEIFGLVKKQLELSHEKCDDLVLGREHPELKKALQKLGDSAAMRKSLQQNLDETLVKIEGALSDLLGRSGTSEVENAISYASSLLSTLDALRNSRGEDKNARETTDKWPDIVSRFKEAGGALKDLKHWQRVLDPGPGRCKERDEKLREKIREVATNLEERPEGVEDLRQYADGIGVEYEKKFDDAKRKKDELVGYRDKVKNFTPDDSRWRNVKDRMHEQANQIVSYYEHAFQEIERDCGNLRKGKEHPEVRAALKDLETRSTDAGRALSEVKRLYDEWKNLNSEFRSVYKDRLDAIRLAMCKGDEDAITKHVDAAAAEGVSRLSPKYTELKRRADDIFSKIAPLEKDKSVNTEARRVKRNLKAALKKLEKAADTGLLLGKENPKLEVHKAYGDKMHREIQGNSSKCTAIEVRLSSGRLDCVKVNGNTCDLIEIKPNNDEAKAFGMDQLKERLDVLRGMRKSDLADVFKSCLKDEPSDKSSDTGWVRYGELRVETYEFCPSNTDEIAPALEQDSEE